MQAIEELWSSDDPTEPGWYAVLMGWDVSEGSHPDGWYFDGQTWKKDSSATVSWRSLKSFEDKKSAYDWASEHDPIL